MMNTKLFIVMGILWLLELIPSLYHDISPIYSYVVDICNLMQGVLVFLIFVFKRKVLISFQKKLGKIHRNYNYRIHLRLCQTQRYDFPIGKDTKKLRIGTSGGTTSMNTNVTSMDDSMKKDGRTSKANSLSTVSTIRMTNLKN
jgi:hypothetical protein